MIDSRDFYRLIYRYPNLKGKGVLITEVLGFDTEAYSNGRPFLYAFSNGIIYDCRECNFDIKKIFDDFSFPEKGKTIHFSVYNLKYDSGAVLYFLPDEVKAELWYYGDVQYEGVKIEYIPHKNLKLRYNKCTVNFWDVSQYYSMTLDRAAKKYLGKQKIEVGTKKFTVENVNNNWKNIVEYCIVDSELCGELTVFLIGKLSEFGIRTTALYSSASLSFRYFADYSPKIVTCWRPWKYYQEAVKYAIDSYQGGKFEVTARGSFYGYEYDIVSAYPYEIRKLIDITFARYEKSNKYIEKADYGFIRCKVKNVNGVHLPFGPMIQNTRIYPAGEFYATITKAEYEYCIEYGVEIEIDSAWWLIVGNKKSCPYEKTIDTLFKLKAQYKGNDAMLYEVSKRMLNSFYGKMVQCIEKRVRPDEVDGVEIEIEKESYIQAGAAFNPFFASIITANTRLKVCRLQQELKEKCLAVHTDSVITTCEIDQKYLSGELGGFDYVTHGQGCIIACGEYFIGDKAAYKGFRPIDADTWLAILARNATKSKIPYPVVKVETWREAVAKGHYGSINLFSEDTKEIDLNADVKRIWAKRITAGDLLKKLEQSKQVVYCGSYPDHWKKDYKRLLRTPKSKSCRLADRKNVSKPPELRIEDTGKSDTKGGSKRDRKNTEVSRK
jgi:hypothetical protein